MENALKPVESYLLKLRNEDSSSTKQAALVSPATIEECL